MNLTIEHALGHKYLMFYHSHWPVDLVTPICTLNQSIDTVNQYIKKYSKNLQKWTNEHQDVAARLVWVNWIYQHLSVEPIRKPVLTHLENGQHIVDCGDTRLMALNLLSSPGTVGVVCTVNGDKADQFAAWQPVRTNQDLIEVTRFSAGAHVMLRSGITQAIEWLEIGDNTTSHHLHAVDQRVNMMQNYINQHSDVVFDVEWARSHINWSCYAN
jgi:hypothetical protein